MEETYYDQIADGYENLHREEQQLKIEFVVEQLKSFLANNEDKFSDKKLRIADIGCGPYFADFENRIKDYDVKVIGFDPSAKLIDIAKTKIEAHVGSAEEIKLQDEAVDVLVSITAAQNFSDMKKAALEMFRIVKHFGIVSIIGPSSKKDELRKSLTSSGFKIIDEFSKVKDYFFIISK